MLQKTQKIISETHERVRNLSHQLFSPTLMKFGLATAIKELCEKLSSEQLKILFHSINLNGQLSEELEVKVYHMVTELLNNMIKHSGASEGHVHVTLENDDFSLIVRDNGKGIRADTITEGVGLKRIQAQVNDLKGTMEINRVRGINSVNIGFKMIN